MLWPCSRNVIIEYDYSYQVHSAKLNSQMLMAVACKYISAAGKQVIENRRAKTITVSASVTNPC